MLCHSLLMMTRERSVAPCEVCAVCEVWKGLPMLAEARPPSPPLPLPPTLCPDPTFRMAAVSSISAMNVDTPRCWQSPAPTRAKMASRTAMRAESHGTKQPT